jgi:transposase-like protein
MTDKLVCKYCQSESVIKYGKYKDTQYYLCKSCGKKFSNPDAIPKMQYSTSKVADAISMYFEGMSLKEIRRNFIQQHNDYISDVTVLNWVNRFTDLAVAESKKHIPDVGSVWVADETVLNIDGKNIWLWDIIDAKTRFLIATHMSVTRTSEDAEQLMKLAYERTGKIPRVIYTDKLRAPANEPVKSWLTYDMLLLETAVICHHKRLAEILFEALRDTPFKTTGFWYPTCVARHFGGAASLLNRFEEARKYYQEAIKVCTEMRFRPELTLTLLQLAELLIEHYPQEKSEAIAHLDFCIKEFRDMKMNTYLERALKHKDIMKA